MRLFVSSPTDVMPERARVDAVAERLNAEFSGLVNIEVIRWEQGFYTAEQSFQEAIDGAVDRMRDTDMVVCILWKRVGSELNPETWRRPDGTPFESGTVLEFETARDMGRRQGTPDVYLFRKTAPIAYAAESYEVERAQHKLMETVWQRWTQNTEGHNVAGYQTFVDPDDFERQLELCLRQWLERRGIVLRRIWDRRVQGSPFRGLAAFGGEHAAVFFGREAAISRAVARLREATPEPKFLLVLGASGSGKSSLLRAGIIPRLLRAGTIPGIDLWRLAFIAPGSDPIRALAEALFTETALGPELREGDFRSAALLAGCLAGGGEVAAAPLHAALERAAARRAAAMGYDTQRPVRLLLAIDQVEQLFTDTEPATAQQFAETLNDLARHAPVTVVAALRSDAYAHFQRLTGFVSLLEEGGVSFNLLPPTAAELDDITRQPVAACHPPLAFEVDPRGHSLADRLIADAAGGDTLPLLQMTLQRLYEAEAARGDGILRFADYRGIEAAVRDAANEALSTLDDDAQAELPALLTALVSDIARDNEGKSVPLAHALDRTLFERGLASRAALVDAFVTRRLLSLSDSDGRLEIRPVHDALLRTWPTAVRIVDENAALIHVRHTLEPMAADWAGADAGGKPGYLVSSAALLGGAEQLMARFGDDLPSQMREFIAASLVAEEARRHAAQQRQRRVLATIAAGLVVTASLAGIAGWQWRVAAEQDARAEDTLYLAMTSAQANAVQIGALVTIANTAESPQLPGLIKTTTKNVIQTSANLANALGKYTGDSPRLRLGQAAVLNDFAAVLLNAGDPAQAMTEATAAHDILRSLTASEPDNIDALAQLAMNEATVGDAMAAQNRHDTALDSYRRSLVVYRKLSAREPGHAPWQMGQVFSLIKLARAGSDTRANFTEALAILRKLDANADAGLHSQTKPLIDLLETALKANPP